MHLPLAVVHNRKVGDAALRTKDWMVETRRKCGDRKRWAARGSKWHALDRWGQIIGTSAVTEVSFYDVTGCNELALSPEHSNETLFVSADSGFRPSPSAAFLPARSQARSFRALTARVLDDRAISPQSAHDECRDIIEKEQFFSSQAGEHYAIGTSNVGYLLAVQVRGRWSVLRSERDIRSPDNYGCFRPIAIFDMNQDGVPEVVLRHSSGESWCDAVLGRNRAGKWELVAISPGSALV